MYSLILHSHNFYIEIKSIYLVVLYTDNEQFTLIDATMCLFDVMYIYAIEPSTGILASQELKIAPKALHVMAL